MTTLTLPTAQMVEARTIDEMADAFHPSQFTDPRDGAPRRAHRNPEMDGVEAALLWAAGRISKTDFLSVVEGIEP